VFSDNALSELQCADPSQIVDQRDSSAHLVLRQIVDRMSEAASEAELCIAASSLGIAGGVDRASIASAIDSAARNGESVARRRYQRGSVYQNKAKTVWLGNYAEYMLDSDGAEKRVRREVVLGAVRKPDATVMSKREDVDRINSSLSTLARERKSATFDAFAQIWEQDYLSLSKASTQSTMRGHIKRLKSVFTQKDMRQISTGDLQRVIASMVADEYQPKTIRNLWATVRLIWDAALAQGYVDRVLPKPRLPRVSRKVPKYFRLEDVAKIIAHSHGEQRVFYWLAAETGLRAGEIAGLRLGDVEPERISVSQSVWHGRVQAPKSDNALRTIAVSPQLGVLLLEQSERQKGKGHDFLFSSSTGSPWDASLFRRRKLKPLLRSLGVREAGFHGFRHFNASLLSSLRIPLKVIQERLGHDSDGSLTLDVYTHAEWEENVEAAQLAGEKIEKAVNSVSLTAVKEKEPPIEKSEALEAA
jgi:integrase